MIEVPAVVMVIGISIISFLLGMAAGRAIRQDKVIVAVVSQEQCRDLIELEME